MMLICTTVFLAGATAVLAADPVGTIVSISGKATATAADGTSRNLELKSPVHLNDRIKTDAGASLQIMFVDDSVLSQGEKSEMVIDEYSFNPQKKEDNKCSLKLCKGLFRAVTAKITAINPERFKVKTSMATIGIRGCEVAFTLSQKEENIYVLSLPDGKSITVTLNADLDLNLGNVVNKETAIEIIKAGTVVQIQEGSGMTQRQITPQEAIDILDQVSPDEGPGDTDQPPVEDDTAPPPTDMVDAASQQDTENNVEQAEEEAIGAADASLPDEGGGGSKEPPEFVPMGGGPGWSWGVWASPGSTPESVEFTATSPLSDSQVQNIMYGMDYYYLSGSGDAAAVVTDGGNRYFLTGMCSVSVDIGDYGALGSWGASINTSDMDGNSFDFSISPGTIVNGVLTGSISSYNLFVGGQSFASPETALWSAQLSGSGNPPNPIDAIVGKFDFTQNGGLITIQGGFGATFPYAF